MGPKPMAKAINVNSLQPGGKKVPQLVNGNQEGNDCDRS